MEPCAVRWTLFVDSFASFAWAATQPACWPTSAERTPSGFRPRLVNAFALIEDRRQLGELGVVGSQLAPDTKPQRPSTSRGGGCRPTRTLWSLSQC
jgi:hypothetical protein